MEEEKRDLELKGKKVGFEDWMGSESEADDEKKIAKKKKN